jgi:peptidoglycan/LPS O-acetylase OafA/YrhL
VEEQFYLIWPAVVLLCTPVQLRRLCVAVVVGALILRVVVRGGIGADLAAYTLMPARADGLAAGAWLAVALRTGTDLGTLQRRARRLLPLMVAACAALFVWRRSFWAYDAFVQTVGYSCLALGFAALMCLSLDSPGRETRTARWFRTATRCTASIPWSWWRSRRSA